MITLTRLVMSLRAIKWVQVMLIFSCVTLNSSSSNRMDEYFLGCMGGTYIDDGEVATKMSLDDLNQCIY